MRDEFWGRPESFWVGIQAIFAIAAFIILFFYTLYTRRMMRLAEETRRSTVKPIFSIRFSAETEIYRQERDPRWGIDVPVATKFFTTQFEIRNIGQGPGIYLNAWYQSVTNRFALNGTTIYQRNEHSRDGESTRTDIIQSETANVTFPQFDGTMPWLFVVECIDAAGGRHQLQILRRPKTPTEIEVEIKMAHALGDSRGERMVRLTRRFVEIIQRIHEESEKVVD